MSVSLLRGIRKIKVFAVLSCDMFVSRQIKDIKYMSLTWFETCVLRFSVPLHYSGCDNNFVLYYITFFIVHWNMNHWIIKKQINSQANSTPFRNIERRLYGFRTVCTHKTSFEVYKTHITQKVKINYYILIFSINLSHINTKYKITPKCDLITQIQVHQHTFKSH